MYGTTIISLRTHNNGSSNKSHTSTSKQDKTETGTVEKTAERRSAETDSENLPNGTKSSRKEADQDEQRQKHSEGSSSSSLPDVTTCPREMSSTPPPPRRQKAAGGGGHAHRQPAHQAHQHHQHHQQHQHHSQSHSHSHSHPQHPHPHHQHHQQQQHHQHHPQEEEHYRRGGKWVCPSCEAFTFDSYDDMLRHESECRLGHQHGASGPHAGSGSGSAMSGRYFAEGAHTPQGPEGSRSMSAMGPSVGGPTSATTVTPMQRPQYHRPQPHYPHAASASSESPESHSHSHSHSHPHHQRHHPPSQPRPHSEHEPQPPQPHQQPHAHEHPQQHRPTSVSFSPTSTPVDGSDGGPGDASRVGPPITTTARSPGGPVGTTATAPTPPPFPSPPEDPARIRPASAVASAEARTIMRHLTPEEVSRLTLKDQALCRSIVMFTTPDDRQHHPQHELDPHAASSGDTSADGTGTSPSANVPPGEHPSSASAEQGSSSVSSSSKATTTPPIITPTTPANTKRQRLQPPTPHDAPQSPRQRLIGLQCRYCMESPLAYRPTNRFDKVFPGSIESLSATLELVKQRHFVSGENCDVMPDEIRSAFMSSPERPDAEGGEGPGSEKAKENSRNLQRVCENLCRRMGIVNREPYKTGMVTYSTVFEEDAPSLAGRSGSRNANPGPPGGSGGSGSGGPLRRDSGEDADAMKRQEEHRRRWERQQQQQQQQQPPMSSQPQHPHHHAQQDPSSRSQPPPHSSMHPQQEGGWPPSSGGPPMGMEMQHAMMRHHQPPQSYPPSHSPYSSGMGGPPPPSAGEDRFGPYGSRSMPGDPMMGGGGNMGGSREWSSQGAPGGPAHTPGSRGMGMPMSGGSGPGMYGYPPQQQQGYGMGGPSSYSPPRNQPPPMEGGGPGYMDPAGRGGGSGPPPPSFVRDPMGAGWVCPHCSMTPYHMRAPNSFSRDPPSMEYIEQHYSVCTALVNSPYGRGGGGQGGTFSQPNPSGPQGSYQPQPYPPGCPPPPHHMGPSSSAGWSVPSPSSRLSHDPHGEHMGGPMDYGEPIAPQSMHGGYPPQTPHHHMGGGVPPFPMHHPHHPSPHHHHHSEMIAGGMTSPAAVRSTDSGRAAADFLAAESSRANLESDPDALVLPEDKLLLTDYFYFLNQQLKLCRFTEKDRKTRGGKRENIEVGYGGLECRHCAGESGSRKFFWSDVDRLANSFAEIPGHIMKCRKCPDEIKAALQELKLRHPEQMAKLPRGSQKVFFRRMWRRLHPNSEAGGSSSGQTPAPSAAGSSSAATSARGAGSPASPEPPSNTDPNMGPQDLSTVGTSGGMISVGSPSSSRVLLAINEDKQWLSDVDCNVRRSLEVFCASEAEVTLNQVDRRYPVQLGQVGIRCVHCASSPEGAMGHAVSYPFSINGIYEAVREFQRLHLDKCPNLPPELRSKTQHKQAASLSSVLRRYYVIAAKALGMYDTSDGIRSEGGSIPVGPSAPLDLTPLKFEEQEGGGGDTGRSFSPGGGAPESRKRKSESPPLTG